MTQLAIIEVIVPDDVKLDDVFNYMKSNKCQMKLGIMKPNPNDPPLTESEVMITVTYKSRGAQDASEIENEINNALISVKGVTEVKVW